jgi:hypothetical protein
MLIENGYLYIDVPSTGVLLSSDMVEEFFIDKHTYHFSFEVLTKYIQMLGFDLIFAEDDSYNIVIIASKKNKTNKITINKYKEILINNHQNIRKVADEIHDMCNTQKVALYGASKIYDALVTHGNLDTKKPIYVVDDYLFGYIDQVHGRELSKSELLTSDNVDVVILLTRSATQELIEKLKQKGIKNIIEFSKLINKI